MNYLNKIDKKIYIQDEYQNNILKIARKFVVAKFLYAYFNPSF